MVFTTGSDLPSSLLQLPVWLSRSGGDVLKSRPIVAVDRRGMGMSSPGIDRRDAFDRQQMREQAQFQSGDDVVANLGAITTTATTGCTDALARRLLLRQCPCRRGSRTALRSTWDVPGLAIMGIG